MIGCFQMFAQVERHIEQALCEHESMHTAETVGRQQPGQAVEMCA
jgi:hypothetical protein